MKLLILGGSHSDIPLILSAKQLGFYVITTGTRPDDLGHEYSDEYVKGDYSNINEMLNIVKSYNINCICPCCNDFSLLTCAYISDTLQLNCCDSYDVSLTLHHKDRFKQFCLEYGLPTPKGVECIDIEQALEVISTFNYPIIVKPIDLTGGKGVSKINTAAEASSYIQKAFEVSRAKKVVIEEFIEGTNHGFSVMLRNKKVAFYFYDDEYYYLNPYLVAGASAPGSVSLETINVLCSICEKIALLLNLKDGIFHVQYILKDSQIYLTDVCRRAPGDLYIQFVKHATGVDYPTYILKSFLNYDISDLQFKSINGFFTRHCVMPSKNGIVKDVFIHSAIAPKVIDTLMWWKPGDIINNYLTQKVGIVFLKYSSFEEMKTFNTNIHELIKVVME